MTKQDQGITLITGVIGFIGFHLAKSLLLRGYSVLGIDNMNDYYDIRLKEERLRYLKNIDKDF
ncbi:MAG: GDP-mannose 4,6-dehydratase [Amoebophilaceae bacterium]|nr:GDP-mannose 4,6-dehydratase [Amoebophilaceae bacterium]